MSSPEIPPEGHAAELQRAYDLIVHEHDGGDLVRICSGEPAIIDALIGIALGNMAGSGLEDEKRTDRKNLAAGAFAVLSRMHFNPEQNCYVSLGLPRSATLEEVNRRWKRLMLLYHPDRHRGDNELIAASARKVNDAYSTLKDARRRDEHNRRLDDQYLNRRFPGDVLHGGRSDALPEENRHAAGRVLHRHRKSALLVTAAVCGVVIAWSAVPHGRISWPDSVVTPAMTYSDRAESGDAGTRKSSVYLQSGDMTVSSRIFSGKQDLNSAGDAGRSEPGVRSARREALSGPEDMADQLPRSGQAPPLNELSITREEVDDLIRQYVRAYTKSDLNAIMSLFSPAAVGNNTMTYSDIRNAYREEFRDTINFFTLQAPDIRMDSRAITISGIYRIDRYRASEDRWVKLSGKVIWKLDREEDLLRIVSMQHER